MARWGHFFYGQAHYDEPDNPTNPTIKRTHMYDLHKVLINPFDDPHISVDHLLSFTTDHLGKMTNNNAGGFLAARITATTTALGGMNTNVVTDEDKLGLRKGSKKAKDAFRKTLPAGVAKINGALVSQFGAGAPQIDECLPGGRSVFNACKDDQVANKLQTLVDGVTKYQTQLGAPVVTAATALLSGWNAVYQPSESASSIKDAAMGGKNTARGALQLELFRNLLTIALQYPRQPEMVDVYMQQSLLEPHTKSTTTPPPAPAPTTKTAKPQAEG